MMTLFSESSEKPGGRAVLLSIKPRYADLILSGAKRVEFRRSWPSNDIGVMVLYSSSPVQQIVGVAYVEKVNEADTRGLWKLACEYGGGLEKDELDEYFVGKKMAYGIVLNHARTAAAPTNPKELFPTFVPPQSFQYLTPADFHLVMRTIFPEEHPA